MLDNNESNYSGDVLIVDDIDINLQLISEILDKNNIRVKTAHSGKEALEIAQQVGPDLILLDVAMPEMDGYTVCEQLKENDSTSNIPVIFVSAKNQTDDIVRGLKLGAVDYLTKPYKSQELLSRVITHLDLKRSKDLINKQNETLKQTNNQLTKSLSYAKHIQDKLLPELSKIQEYLPETFILHKSKYLVSGDFYWFNKQDNLLFLAVIDCTGHGMPGALMSMIGNTLLNEIIIKNKITDPAEILKTLNSEVVKTLKKEDSSDEFDNEGMDISLCCIDTKNNQAKISCANQDVYYIQDGILHTIEGQIFSIGRECKETKNLKFTTTIINLTNPTYIYMMSDGFQDQFGGTNNKKFQINQLKELIVKNHKASMPDQYKVFQNKLDNWKGDNELTDDILVVGFKL